MRDPDFRGSRGGTQGGFVSLRGDCNEEMVGTAVVGALGWVLETGRNKGVWFPGRVRKDLWKAGQAEGSRSALSAGEGEGNCQAEMSKT